MYSTNIDQHQDGRQQAPNTTPDPKGGHYVLHIEDIVRDNGRTGLAIYGEILREADRETSASRVAALIKDVITRNPSIIGEVMIDTIKRNREDQQ